MGKYHRCCRREYFTALDQTADGGYIIGGYSHSNANGDKTEDLIGDHDY